MREYIWTAVAVGLTLIGGPVHAQTVTKAAAPAWVTAPPSEAPTPSTADAALRILAIDHQIHFDAQGTHTYVFQRYQVLTRQGLSSVGTVNLEWTPPRQTIEVHALRVVRDGQAIDVLADQEFQTLRREDNLESAVLDGQLTATLQPRDLRVGDILELAFTVHDSGGVIAPHLEAFDSVGSGQTVDHYRLRATWDDAHPMRITASRPWTDLRPRRSGRDWLYEVDARDLAPERVPGDLPGRLTLSRTVQFTDFAAWDEASRLMAPLYETAATLEADSPLRAEIERIRAAEPTAAGQAAAALRLVEDQVRYLALSMGDGNYTPASADDVWRSRYGDCKGKTVLLLALLKGLGIEAEAALVSTTGGDGLDGQPPLLSWFDHVIVRAAVDGQIYWMDGTGIGDRALADLTPPGYRWALPVRAGGANLEAIPLPPATHPAVDARIELDARAGIDVDAPMVFDIAYHDGYATTMRRQLGVIPQDQLETMLRSQLGGDSEVLKISGVETRYDEPTNVLHLIMRGTMRMTWVSGPSGRLMAFPDSAVVLPIRAERKGLLAAFKDDPYAIPHPAMNRTVLRVVLPQDGRGFQLEGGDQTLEGAGYRVTRRGTLDQGVAEVEMTTLSLAPEVPAADMAAARTRAESASALPMRLRAPADYAATPGDSARRQPGESDTADLITRAGRLADTGDDAGALALLDAAITREPDNVEALRARGRTRQAARDFDGARADFDHAVELDPADQAAALGQGLAAFSQGHYDDAIVSFSVALRLDPSDATALSGRGAAYYNRGRWDRSLADYRAARTAEPTDATGAFGELRALIRLDREVEARALIDARLGTDPTDGVALRGLVRLDKRLGRPGDALPALDRAIAAVPDSANLLGLRGEVRALGGDVEGARGDFTALRRLDPSDPQMLNEVCWAQALAGFNLEQALVDCDGALSTGEPAYIDSRAMVLLQMGRYAEAKADYERALVGAPDQTASIYGRGLARLALGDDGGREDLVAARSRNVDIAETFSVFEARHPDLVK